MTPYYEKDGQTIFHADCRDILPHVGRFDLCLTDPPYGIVNWSANATGGFMDGEMALETSAWDAEPAPAVALTYCRELANEAIIWGGNYFDLPPSPRVLIWDKAQDGMHFAEAEVAWTNFTHGTTRICRCPVKSQETFGINSERMHPTQKPIRLMLWCISKAKNPQSVIDPFLGSGTTLVACKKLGIRGVGIEREEKYCEIAAKRLENTTPSLFAETP